MFVVPKSFLERKLAIYMLSRDETVPSATSMPTEVIGNTDVVD